MATSLAHHLTTTPLQWALGGWTFFLLENVLLSENRTYLLSRLGDDTYHAIYGTCSTLAMGSVAYGYRRVRGAPPLLLGAVPTVGGKMVSLVCLSLGLGIISQMTPKLQIPVEYYGSVGKTTTPTPPPEEHVTNGPMESSETNDTVSRGWKVRCPFDFTDKKQQPHDGHVPPLYGVERISRHPGLWSLAFLGLGNAMLVPSLPQRVWLSMPVLVAFIGGAHTDSRYRRGMGGELPKEYDDMTSNVPFWAMITGRQGNVLEVFKDAVEEVKPLNAALAVGAAGMFVWRRGRGGMKMPVR
ncbi:hypothetical protein HJC23_009310 [Cyclotella cryptica]|uniref:NnrU domain-containing protein n=1 Tax=Cyclotella cryptica TaxID=29204 RepID=A0ABD3QUQ2_9STRA